MPTKSELSSKTAKIGDEVVHLYCDDILSSIRTRDNVSEACFHPSEFDFKSLEGGGAKGRSLTNEIRKNSTKT